ncbi:3D domain-containing protein [Bacillus mycoides]|uniref:3D domain-containing protein n=1 Tax=Bacillus mycoides TaxID=1405 RepID=UPI003D66153E
MSNSSNRRFFTKKKILITLTTLLVAAGIAAASKISYDYYHSTQKQIHSYQEKLSEKDSAIHKIEEELSSSKGQIEGLEKEKVELGNQKTELEQQKSNLEGEVKQRDTRVSELEAENQKLKEAYSSQTSVSVATPKKEVPKKKEQEQQKSEEKKEPAVQAAPTPQSNKGSGDWKNFEITAYTNHPSENGGTYGGKVLTAKGQDITNKIQHNGERIIAVDPNVIPLGSTVEIEGYGQFKALDTGGAIKGNRIDVLVGSNGEMENIGRRGAKVRVVN